MRADPSGCWELPGLFVADGSVIPTSLGVNPQETVMAMATRIAFKLRER
jgi:choline dehydrogenase-like flavoprotein